MPADMAMAKKHPYGRWNAKTPIFDAAGDPPPPIDKSER